LALAEARPGLRIEGIDVSEEMVGHARRAAIEAGLQDRMSFSVGDVADLGFPDDTFDLIVSTLSQHHWANVGGGVRELIRVLKPTGQIWIYDGRFQLRNAEAAARAAGPSLRVRRDALRGGPLWLRLIARLIISPA
jgi:ubiquinone/menaquinone biosynthesis C-methylase UbiE